MLVSGKITANAPDKVTVSLTRWGRNWSANNPESNRIFTWRSQGVGKFRQTGDVGIQSGIPKKGRALGNVYSITTCKD